MFFLYRQIPKGETKMKKRVLSVVLALILLIGTIPMTMLSVSANR